MERRQVARRINRVRSSRPISVCGTVPPTPLTKNRIVLPSEVEEWEFVPRGCPGIGGLCEPLTHGFPPALRRTRRVGKAPAPRKIAATKPAGNHRDNTGCESPRGRSPGLARENLCRGLLSGDTTYRSVVHENVKL